MPPSISRRGFCRASFAGALQLAGMGLGSPAAAASEAPLKLRAAKKGIRFGSEVLYRELSGDPHYARLVVEQCEVVTPGLEAKWAEVEPSDGEFHFEELDWIVDFATAHKIEVRGHNLLWGVYDPLWAEVALMVEGRGEEILQRHIATEVGRYKGRIKYWDVVNEPTDPKYSPLPDGLVDTIWRKHIGPLVIDDAFRWAAEADGSAILFVNDDNLEYDEPDREEKRNTYLRLVETWLSRGVPIKGFGLESHLQPTRRIADKQYRRFLSELAGMGLTIHITELDVGDRDLPAEIPQRDRIVADFCKHLLDIALDEKAVTAVVTWGLTDRYSYQNESPDLRRPDGLPSRSLPFDADLKPKPMWYAIAAALDHAPAR